jgi:hypothetical protein
LHSVSSVTGIFSSPNPCNRTGTLNLSKRLTEMSTRNFPAGGLAPTHTDM